MSQFIYCAVLLLLVVHRQLQLYTLDPVSLPGNGETETCPAQEKRDAAIQNISNSVQMIIQNIPTSPNLAVHLNCGAGQWYHVAYLNNII